MKEMFSISSGANIAKTKPVETASSKEVLSDDKSSSKDFLSILFSQIKESIDMGKDNGKLAIDIPTEEVKIDLSNDTAEKSIDEHLLEDILKVITLLKNPDDKNVSFPSFSNKLEKIINNETALKELKEVSNITDLLKLSKKYDLGLEKISIKSLDVETFKKEFPTLDKKQFFELPKETNTKTNTTPIQAKKESDIKATIINVRDMEKSTTQIKKEPSILEKMMSSPTKDIKEVSKPKSEALHVDKEIIKEKIIEDKKEITTKITEEVKKSEKTIQEVTPKVVVKSEEKDIKVKTIKEDLDTKISKEIKTPDTTRVNEPKVESNIPKQGSFENILQGIKQTKTTIETKPTNETNLKTENSKVEKLPSETNEVKTEPVTNKTDLKPQMKAETQFAKQNTTAKETFNNFANDLREKIENYKPPIMKVQMLLNPKGLGEVDVVVVNRGNNLHVNISSNTNTMSLFTQNQAEFKNSLVNMGFTNLEMNFSDQRENKEQQNNNKSSKSFNDNFEDENLEEETTAIELVVPQYV
ncbi:flagellar hook-length control protein FliK [Sulfurospirillum arcachonense]|uniref:flagellar hook-length control protein FliK n=1 Tax=Sulfurospirillum arcachonense TaxID=57666 RepID=UPI00046AB077|nr:flagellar hook-length control protein FliK [Sulfurospirillum arcachonense]